MVDGYGKDADASFIDCEAWNKGQLNCWAEYAPKGAKWHNRQIANENLGVTISNVKRLEVIDRSSFERRCCGSNTAL